MTDKTPAELAKEFAAANGISIRSEGRRYVLTDESVVMGKEFAEVGGYPAALNAMRKYVETRDAVPISTGHGLDKLAQHPAKVPPSVGYSVGNIHYGHPGGSGGATIATLREEDASNRTVGTLSDPEWAAKTADDIKQDIVALVNEASQHPHDIFGKMPAPIPLSKRAKREMRKWARALRLSYLPPTHQLEFRFGIGAVFVSRFPSYAEALRQYRQLMSEENKAHRPVWAQIVPFKGAAA
jgi:hypothetical protein